MPTLTITSIVDSATGQPILKGVITSANIADGITFNGTETGGVQQTAFPAVETMLFDSSGTPIHLAQDPDFIEEDAGGMSLFGSAGFTDLTTGTWAVNYFPQTLRALAAGTYTFKAFLDPTNILDPREGSFASTSTPPHDYAAHDDHQPNRPRNQPHHPG